MSDTVPIQTRLLLVGAEPSRSLRADERVELVRLRSAVEAVAELASPSEYDAPPCARVLALAEGSINAADAPNFLAAARLADPTAVLLLWRRDDSTPVNGLAHGFDAVVAGPLSLDTIRASVPSPPRPASAPPAPAPGPAPATSRPADPKASQASTPPAVGAGVDLASESVDLEALLTGGDSREAFLGALRRRLADPTLRLAANADATPAGVSFATIERRGTAFGLLCSSRLNESALRDAAAWLAVRLALAEQMRQLREAALTDPLTGAHNRRFFDRYLPHALEQARARRMEAHLLIIDIDDFKQYNDRFGHPAGDEILVETARMLKSVVRPGDKVCRIGGDEFAVVFFETEGRRDPSPGQAASSGPPSLSISKVAARIQRVVCEKRFPKLGHDAPGRLSVSGGLATFPWDAVDATTLIAKADQLALQSKAAGKSVITLGPGSRSCLER